MTSQAKHRENKLTGAKGILLSTALTAAVFMAAIYLSDDLGVYVAYALELSVRIIIPSTFPFLIITGLVEPHLKFEAITPACNFFERMFKINGNAIPIYICGMLCGFPIGAKMAYEAYKCGKLSRDECERLMVFSSNASPSYIIGAVGGAIRGSIRDGALLYLSTVMSSIITGILIGIKKEKSNLSYANIEQKTNFVDIVKNAASISINICAFICTFGIFVGITKAVIKIDVLKAVFISVLEIGNAAIFLSEIHNISIAFSLALTSFAISFSGLSVILQTLAIQDKNDRIDARIYIIRKFIQGLISGGITLIIYLTTA